MLNINLCGIPGAGKTTFAAYLGQFLPGRRVRIFASDPTAHSLRGIPPAWRKNMAVTLVGYDETPKGFQRKSGAAYFKAVLDTAGKACAEDIIIVDSINGIGRARYNDALELIGGIPSEYRRENEAPQQLMLSFMERIWAANMHAHILTLQHVKQVYVGKDRVFDTFWPELIGSKLDATWGNRFDTTLFVEPKDEVVADPVNRMVKRRERHYRLYFEAESDCKFVFVRGGLGAKSRPPLDITVKDAADTAPLDEAWAAIFEAVGEPLKKESGT